MSTKPTSEALLKLGLFMVFGFSHNSDNYMHDYVGALIVINSDNFKVPVITHVLHLTMSAR